MTDENYNTQITLKVDKAISYKFWWNLIKEKRSLPHAKSNKLPLALKPENKRYSQIKRKKFSCVIRQHFVIY